MKRWLHFFATLVTRDGRDHARQLRFERSRAEVIAARLEMAGYLTRIGNREICIAELEQQDAAAAQPAVHAATQRVLDSLSDVVRQCVDQLDRNESTRRGWWS